MNKILVQYQGKGIKMPLTKLKTQSYLRRQIWVDLKGKKGIHDENGIKKDQ